MKPTIKILIATHQLKVNFENEVFYPIQVGVDSNNLIIDEKYYLDNSGINISSKNKNFNELTAYFWAWKNLDCDIIGLMHYRRLFDFSYKKPIFKKDKSHAVVNVNFNDKRVIKSIRSEIILNSIQKNIKNDSIIIPKPVFCTLNDEFESLASQYSRDHISSDWKKCIEIILHKYPEYKESIKSFLEESNIFYIGNMFIAPKKWFDEYCKWLFDILFELEKQITINIDPYQARVFGFLSERLFTLYILHNKLKIKELPILFIE